jgi:hypothetical protein
MATSPTQFLRNITIGTGAAAALGDPYVVPASTTDKLYEFIFCNSHTAAVGVTIHLVPSGGSATAANKILDSTNYVLNPGETRRFGLEQRMATGAQIFGTATVTGVVSVHLAGDRVTP